MNIVLKFKQKLLKDTKQNQGYNLVTTIYLIY